MAYRELKGNLFSSDAQVLVNTVNCVGVMGRGVALEFRRRFPRMFEAYRDVCAAGRLRPGQILPYRQSEPWILNFAVKDDWKHPSCLGWVEACLQRFVESHAALGINSVALPWLGAMNGRLPWGDVHALIRQYLQSLADVDISLYEFDPGASDRLFERLQAAVRSMTARDLASAAGITTRAATTIHDTVAHGEVPSLARLCEVRGLGKTTIENLYRYLTGSESTTTVRGQLTLWSDLGT